MDPRRPANQQPNMPFYLCYPLRLRYTEGQCQPPSLTAQLKDFRKEFKAELKGLPRKKKQGSLDHFLGGKYNIEELVQDVQLASQQLTSFQSTDDCSLSKTLKKMSSCPLSKELRHLTQKQMRSFSLRTTELPKGIPLRFKELTGGESMNAIKVSEDDRKITSTSGQMSTWDTSAAPPSSLTWDVPPRCPPPPEATGEEKFSVLRKMFDLSQPETVAEIDVPDGVFQMATSEPVSEVTIPSEIAATEVVTEISLPEITNEISGTPVPEPTCAVVVSYEVNEVPPETVVPPLLLEEGLQFQQNQCSSSSIVSKKYVTAALYGVRRGTYRRSRGRPASKANAARTRKLGINVPIKRRGRGRPRNTTTVSRGRIVKRVVQRAPLRTNTPRVQPEESFYNITRLDGLKMVFKLVKPNKKSPSSSACSSSSYCIVGTNGDASPPPLRPENIGEDIQPSAIPKLLCKIELDNLTPTKKEELLKKYSKVHEHELQEEEDKLLDIY